MPWWHSGTILSLQTWPSCESLGLFSLVPRGAQLRRFPRPAWQFVLLLLWWGQELQRRPSCSCRPCCFSPGSLDVGPSCLNRSPVWLASVSDSNYIEFALDDVRPVHGRSKDEGRFIFRMNYELQSCPGEISGFPWCFFPGQGSVGLMDPGQIILTSESTSKRLVLILAGSLF